MENIHCKKDYTHYLDYKNHRLFFIEDTVDLKKQKTKNKKEDNFINNLQNLSELEPYIEEIATSFLKKDFYFDNGIQTITISSILKSDNNNNLSEMKCINKPTITKTIKIIRNRVSKSNTKKVEFNSSIMIDFSFSIKEIMEDFNYLIKTNRIKDSEYELLFDVEKEMFYAMNVSSMKHLRTALLFEKILCLNEETYAFIVFEYAMVRKYMKLNEKNAKIYLKKVFKIR